MCALVCACVCVWVSSCFLAQGVIVVLCKRSSPWCGSARDVGHATPMRRMLVVFAVGARVWTAWRTCDRVIHLVVWILVRSRLGCAPHPRPFGCASGWLAHIATVLFVCTGGPRVALRRWSSPLRVDVSRIWFVLWRPCLVLLGWSCAALLLRPLCTTGWAPDAGLGVAGHATLGLLNRCLLTSGLCG